MTHILTHKLYNISCISVYLVTLSCKNFHIYIYLIHYYISYTTSYITTFTDVFDTSFYIVTFSLTSLPRIKYVPSLPSGQTIPLRTILWVFSIGILLTTFSQGPSLLTSSVSEISTFHKTEQTHYRLFGHT